jgi:putative solute:sodium symporter small subunit
MDPQENDYHISFFKPTTNSARRNRNMVVQFVLIWAVAIFGFQILLKILEKPTPEPAYTQFVSSWKNIEAGSPTLVDFQIAGQSALSVLGKVAIDPEHRAALDNAVSWMAFQIAGSNQQFEIQQSVARFESVAAATTDISDASYVVEKNKLIPVMVNLFNLQPTDVRGSIAPLEIKSSLMESFDAERRDVFVEAMGLYLIHNQSVLTDIKFLGFPFHYFYTAVFLLILFVGLCWLYCVRTDWFNKKYGIED